MTPSEAVAFCQAQAEQCERDGLTDDACLWRERAQDPQRALWAMVAYTPREQLEMLT